MKDAEGTPSEEGPRSQNKKAADYKAAPLVNQSRAGSHPKLSKQFGKPVPAKTAMKGHGPGEKVPNAAEMACKSKVDAICDFLGAFQYPYNVLRRRDILAIWVKGQQRRRYPEGLSSVQKLLKHAIMLPADYHLWFRWATEQRAGTVLQSLFPIPFHTQRSARRKWFLTVLLPLCCSAGGLSSLAVQAVGQTCAGKDRYEGSWSWRESPQCSGNPVQVQGERHP